MFPLPALTSRAGAFVLCTQRMGNATPTNVPTCLLQDQKVVITLLDPSGCGGGACAVRWQVVRLAGARVQDGRVSWGAAATSQAVTLSRAVSLQRSFVLVTTATAATSTNADETRLVTAELGSSSGLTLRRDTAGAAAETRWQVVQLPQGGGSVQRGSQSLGAALVARPALGQAVALARSFLVFSTRAVKSSRGGVEASYLVRGSIEGASRLLFERYDSAAAVVVSWEVVELPAGAAAQHGVRARALDDRYRYPFDLTAPVVPRRSFVLSSASLHAADSSTLDEGSFTAKLAATADQVVLERGDPDDAEPSLAWTVVQLPP